LAERFTFILCKPATDSISGENDHIPRVPQADHLGNISPGTRSKESTTSTAVTSMITPRELSFPTCCTDSIPQQQQICIVEGQRDRLLSNKPTFIMKIALLGIPGC